MDGKKRGFLLTSDMVASRFKCSTLARAVHDVLMATPESWSPSMLLISRKSFLAHAIRMSGLNPSRKAFNDALLELEENGLILLLLKSRGKIVRLEGISCEISVKNNQRGINDTPLSDDGGVQIIPLCEQPFEIPQERDERGTNDTPLDDRGGVQKIPLCEEQLEIIDEHTQRGSNDTPLDDRGGVQKIPLCEQPSGINEIISEVVRRDALVKQQIRIDKGKSAAAAFKLTAAADPKSKISQNIYPRARGGQRPDFGTLLDELIWDIRQVFNTITAGKVRELVETRSLEEVRKQLEWWPHRTKESGQVGWSKKGPAVEFIMAVQEGYPEPEALLRAEAEQRARQESAHREDERQLRRDFKAYEERLIGQQKERLSAEELTGMRIAIRAEYQISIKAEMVERLLGSKLLKQAKAMSFDQWRALERALQKDRCA